MESPGMPNGFGKIRIAAFLALLSAFTGCDLFRGPVCTCDESIHSNVCAQGKYDNADSVAYQRESGSGTFDTHAPGNRECFEEYSGRQRILVLKSGVRIDSSAWFTTRTVDCCHSEGKTVVF